jgi:hypothetical protein
MDQQGMVHALEEAHRLLRPNGKLIDIHPLPEASLLKVYDAGRSVFSEPYPSQSTDDYRHADEAIGLMIERRLFILERRDTFDFLTHGPSAQALADFFAIANAYDQSPKDKGIQAQRAELIARADQVAGSSLTSEVIFLEKAGIASLRPVV